MLKYTIKAGISPNLNEIKYSDLYLAKDLSFISGITDYYEGIRDGEEVSVSSPFLDNSVRLPIRLELVHRQGYVLTKEKFLIHALNHIGDNDESINYIEYNGVFYYEFNKNSLDGFLVNGIFYTKNPNNTVSLPVKNWIENGTVYIKGIKYYADMNLVPNSSYANGYEKPLIKNSETNEVLSKIDGTFIDVIDYEYSKWKNIYKFAIYNINRYTFDATSGITAMYMPFASYNGDVYPIQDIYDDTTSSTTYGCLIGETIYPLSGFTSPEDYYNAEDVSININGKEITVESNLKKADPGLILLLYGNIDTSVIYPGEILIAENDYHIFEIPVSTDVNGNKYIDYNGNIYQVKNRLCDYVTIDNKNYDISYPDSNYSGFTLSIDNSDVSFIIGDDGKAKTKKIKYIIDDKGNLAQESGYTITQRDGIEINNEKYPILSSITTDESGKTIVEENCLLEGIETYDLEIIGTYGGNAVMCSPVVRDSFSDEGVNRIESINSEIADNFSSFRFYFKATALGEDAITPDKYAENALTSDHPISTIELYGLNRGIKIYQISDYITLPIALGNKIDPLPLKDDIIQNSFVNEKINENINRIVDMEKDVYYPAYQLDENNFVPIEEIQFNLHFRTRNLDSWKINEDDTENLGKVSAKFNGNSINLNGNFNTEYSTLKSDSNWFVTDYYTYKQYLENSGHTDVALDLQRSSDLIGLLGFTNDDVKYRKKKIGKSFLKLSFYSTPNPNTQVLLATSTVFMDENGLFKKYMDNGDSFNYMNLSKEGYSPDNFLTLVDKFLDSLGTEKSNFYKSTQPYGMGKDEFDKTNNVNMLYTFLIVKQLIVDFKNYIGDVFTNPIDVLREYSDGNGLLIDENKRLSSQLTVLDKYNSINSSEGFYLYLFREYSTNLRENTVYLKIDFCHAGNGLTIPFIMPMNSSDSDYVGPLYLDSYSDIEEMKKGIPLSELYDNMYIPIKVKYDINTRKYYYYLPSEYVENDKMGVDKRIMMFNLFELKIRNQSYETDY